MDELDKVIDVLAGEGYGYSNAVDRSKGLIRHRLENVSQHGGLPNVVYASALCPITYKIWINPNRLNMHGIASEDCPICFKLP
jgi:hypothetical protein